MHSVEASPGAREALSVGGGGEGARAHPETRHSEGVNRDQGLSEVSGTV